MASDLTSWAKDTVAGSKGGMPKGGSKHKGTAAPFGDGQPKKKDDGDSEHDGGGKETVQWIDALSDDHPKLAKWLKQLDHEIQEGDVEQIKKIWADAPTDEDHEDDDDDGGGGDDEHDDE